MRKLQRGCYLQLEGMDGCGKTTQARLLAQYCTEQGIDFIHIRQPGSTALTEAIRSIVLHQPDVSVRSEFLLMFTCWVETFFTVVLPALSEGKLVISERGLASLFAYQIHGRKLTPGLKIETLAELVDQITSLNEFVELISTDFHEVYVYLRQPIERSMANVQKRLAETGTNVDRFEQESLEFFQRVDEGFESYDTEHNLINEIGVPSRQFQRVVLDIEHRGIDGVHQSLLDVIRTLE